MWHINKATTYLEIAHVLLYECVLLIRRLISDTVMLTCYYYATRRNAFSPL